MIGKTVRLLLALSLAFFSFAEGRGKWRIASRADRGIEFQWYRPVNNSCEVNFRDLQLRKRTSLMATVRYFPHKSTKQAFETKTAYIVIGPSRSASAHFFGCEGVMSIDVNGISRE
jgi:hypothetical protein